MPGRALAGPAEGTALPGVTGQAALAYAGVGTGANGSLAQRALTPTPGAVAAGTGAPGRALSHALEAGRAGARSIGGFGHWFLTRSDGLDAWLYGKRAAVVFLGALVTVAVSAAEAWISPRTPLFTALFTYLFAVFLTLLLVARLGALRDDDGNWSLALVRRRIAEATADAGDLLSSLGALPGALRWKSVGKAAWFLGLLVLALRNVVVLLLLTAEELLASALPSGQEVDRVLLLGGIGALGIGTLCWLIGWGKLRGQPGARLRHGDQGERERLCAAVASLPPIIDCANTGQVLDLAHRAGHPVLEQLLRALSEWRPRRFDFEDQYQGSLYRLLRRKMPDANPQRERPVGSRATRNAGRADLVVSEAVLIEMKRRLTTATAQRALGQVQMYVDAWNQGPVILLLCDADPSVAHGFLGREITYLRTRAPVVLVLAARA